MRKHGIFDAKARHFQRERTVLSSSAGLTEGISVTDYYVQEGAKDLTTGKQKRVIVFDRGESVSQTQNGSNTNSGSNSGASNTGGGSNTSGTTTGGDEPGEDRP